MKYTKPQLAGYSAIAAIQEVDPNAKSEGELEINNRPTDPAYQADE
jgi:hypothetical protein